MLGSYYASKFPERISGLILSSSGGVNMDIFTRLNITSRLTSRQRDSLSYWNGKIAQGDTSYYAKLQRGKFLAPAYLYNTSNTPVIAERLTQGNLAINQLVFQDMRKINFDCTEKLKKVEFPVLVIQGEQDIVDKQVATTSMSVFRNATLVILEKCGHYGWLDQPQSYFKHINTFLDALKS